MLQNWNNAAKKIHIEASNIFSLDTFKDCKEINRRSANKIKKLDNSNFILTNTEGKKSKNKKQKNIVQPLSLLNPFFFATKFVIKIEPSKIRNNNPVLAIDNPEFIQDKSCKMMMKKKTSIKINTKNKINGVDFLKTLVIMRIFYTFVTVNIILVPR